MNFNNTDISMEDFISVKEAYEQGRVDADKFLKQWKDDAVDSLAKYDAESVEDVYMKGKADAVNKFVVNAIKEFQKFELEHGHPTLGDISVILCDVAEELKEKKQ